MDTEEQTKNNEKPWLWKKGQSGNPGGRPKGSKSMKQWVKERLEKMTDEERDEFLAGLPKEIVWRMAEGNPQTNTDLTSKGKEIGVTAVNWNITDGGEDTKSENT